MAVDGDATTGVVRGARRAAIIAVVMSLVIAAVIGIIALVSGEFGELQGRVILSTLTVAAFGTTSLCHLAIVARAVRVVGFVGIAASLFAAVSAYLLIWTEWDEFTDGDALIKALISSAILAASLAQANLLLLLARHRSTLIRLGLGITLIAVATVVAMLWLTIFTDGDIPGDEGSAYWRALGVVGIVDALGTIALPIVALVLRARETPAGRTDEGLPSLSHITISLTPELAERLAADAEGRGVSTEKSALDALERGLPELRGD
jgi:hypothetical protein